MDNALGQASGPTAVDDVVRIVIGQCNVRLVVTGSSCQGVIVVVARGPWRIGEHIPICCDVGHLGLDCVQRVNHAGVGDDQCGVRITQQREEARPAQEGAHWYDDEACFGGGPIDGEQFETVGQNDSELVALGQAEGCQGLGQSIDALVKLSKGQALIAIHHSHMMRTIAGMMAKQCADIHSSFPYNLS
jgi:hypothetical protein